MSSAASMRPDLTFTFGAFEISVLTAMLLTGIATLQVWNYLRDYQSDPLALKLAVFCVYLADVVHSGLLMHALYVYTIIHFGHYDFLATVTRDIIGTVVLAGLIALMVQSYFCLRVYRVTSMPVVAGFLLALAVARFACDLGLAISASQSPFWISVQNTHGQPRKFGLSLLCIGAVSDVLIAGILCASLLRAKSDFVSTTKVVDRIIIFTVGSGLLTSIVATIEAILFGTVENLVFLAFFFVLPKLFDNSLLASLNERKYNRQMISGSDSNVKEEQLTTRMTFPEQHRGIICDVELTMVSDELYRAERRSSWDKRHEAV